MAFRRISVLGRTSELAPDQQCVTSSSNVLVVLDDLSLSLDMIPKGCKMPKFVILSFSSSEFTEAEQTTLMQGSKDIRHVSLRDLMIISGSRKKVFRTTKSASPFKSFDTEYTHEFVDQVTEVGFHIGKEKPYIAIEDFLLGGDLDALSNPTTEMRQWRPRGQKTDEGNLRSHKNLLITIVDSRNVHSIP